MSCALHTPWGLHERPLLSIFVHVSAHVIPEESLEQGCQTYRSFLLQEVGFGQGGIRVSIVACASCGRNAGNHNQAHTKGLRPLSEFRWEYVPILTF